MSEEYQTPAKLLDDLKSLSGVYPNIPALTERVRNITDESNCRYVSYSVGPSRTTQIYICHNRNTIYNCKATAHFSFEDGIVRFISCDQFHTHPIDVPSTHRIRNKLTCLEREKIRTMTKHGLTHTHSRPPSLRGFTPP